MLQQEKNKGVEDSTNETRNLCGNRQGVGRANDASISRDCGLRGTMHSKNKSFYTHVNVAMDNSYNSNPHYRF